MTSGPQPELLASVLEVLRIDQFEIAVEVEPNVFEWATFENRPARRLDDPSLKQIEVLLPDGRWVKADECDVELSLAPKDALEEVEPTKKCPVDCGLYGPGHQTHWIPALRTYVKTQRLKAQVRHVSGNQFILTVLGQEYTRYFHDPAWLIEAIAHNPTGFRSVRGTTFLTMRVGEGGATWFNLSDSPICACVTVEGVEKHDPLG